MGCSALAEAWKANQTTPLLPQTKGGLFLIKIIELLVKKVRSRRPFPLDGSHLTWPGLRPGSFLQKIN